MSVDRGYAMNLGRGYAHKQGRSKTCSYTAGLTLRYQWVTVVAMRWWIPT
jgi:hypothetical protein